MIKHKTAFVFPLHRGWGLTKKHRKELIRALIDRQRKYAVWSEEDTARMQELTSWMHKHFKWIDNPEFPNDPRCIATSDDGRHWEVRSWNKAVDGYDSRKNLQDAMRDAVREDMREHMRTALQVCIECLDIRDLCVDHKDPPFITIAQEYITQHDNLEHTLMNSSQGGGWRMTEHAAAHWKQFHAARASYQILCRSCNSRKGARISANV